MEVKIKKLDPRAILPRYGSPFSAGADICALMDAPIGIAPGETVFIHTGLSAQIPENHVGLIFARSSLGSKRGLAPANKVGVIDSDYRGEIMVALFNHSAETQTIEPFERIAQFMIVPFITAQFIESDTLSDTLRGEGGFGSTGRI
ncbi:MAG: dUTP diphosphatase [Oscillospiraceae bacterium]|nr:dUTP diphosphatase [Oscillospiraceae bacterium]